MDFLPVVGRVPGLDNVWVAGGYSGHGNVLGFACGELVAAAVAGDEPPVRGRVRSGTPAERGTRREPARPRSALRRSSRRCRDR